jgi:hypothetical protein
VRWNKICGFIAIFFVMGQALRAQSLHFVKYNTHIAPTAKSTYKNINSKQIEGSPQNFSRSLQIIPADYYTQHFGFFCKKELAVEKFTKVPIRFRLGSLQQCNYYEGKK